MKDFFISYNQADRQYAEWIAWTLEAAGYSVVIQAWDFRPGGNFVLDMQRAATESQKTIAVLSETYLKSSFTQPEWAAAFAQNPTSSERKLIFVRVKECKPEGMLRPLVYIDLVGLSEVDAKTALLEGLEIRGKPAEQPIFPESKPETVIPSKIPSKEVAPFPCALDRVKQIKQERLQSRFDAIVADYNAISRKIEFTEINSANYNRLERELTVIAEEMDKIARDIDELGQ
jgi:hypothetical protein